MDEFAHNYGKCAQDQDMTYRVLRLYDAYLTIEMEAKTQGRLADPLVRDQFDADFGIIFDCRMQPLRAARSSIAEPCFQLSVGSVMLLASVAM